MNVNTVSIIIPVYNVQTCLQKCIDSVLSQDYNDWELVLVDDGSKDESGKICDEYAEMDMRLGRNGSWGSASWAALWARALKTACTDGRFT